jgi:hypothetical protein
MAVGNYRLTNKRYVRPGMYLGYVRQPRPTGATGTPRYPCYVGRGNRLAQAKNVQMHRAYVTNEALTFIKVVPYLALLGHPALDDQTQAALYKTNRELVPYNKWAFRSSNSDGVYDSVEIVATEFDKNAVYYIDYQSLDRTMQDVLPFDDVRQILAIGNAEGQGQYIEYQDYRVVTELVGNITTPDPEALVPAATNTAINLIGQGCVTGSAIVKVGTGTAAISFAAGSKYTHPYDADYRLIVKEVSSPNVTFEVQINPTSGGNDQHNQVPFHTGLTYAFAGSDPVVVPALGPFTGVLTHTSGVLFSSVKAVASVGGPVTVVRAPTVPVAPLSMSVSTTGVLVFHAGLTGQTVTVTYNYLPSAVVDVVTVTAGSGVLSHTNVLLNSMTAIEAGTGAHLTIVAAPAVPGTGVSVNPVTGNLVFAAALEGIAVTITYNVATAVTPVADFTVDLTGIVSCNLSGANAGNYGWDDGIVLSLPLGATNYVVDDIYTWHAYGPGRIEFLSAHHNLNQFSEVSTPAYLGNIDPALVVPYASSGTLAVNEVTDYNDLVNRDYRFRVYNSGGAPTGRGPAGDRLFTILWSGYKELPYTEGSLQIDETDPATYQQVELEKGIYLDIDLGAGHYNLIVAGADITATAASNLVTALTLAANIKTQWNLHDTSSAAAPALAPGGKLHVGTGVAVHPITLTASDVASLVAFCAEAQTVYAAHLADAVMHTPVDTLWRLSTLTVVDLATAITCLNELKYKANRHFKSFNYVEGDEWTMSAKAARLDFTAKDNRGYTLTVGTVVPGVSMTTAWYTDTLEGGFDSWVVQRDGNTTNYWKTDIVRTVPPAPGPYTIQLPNPYVYDLKIFDSTTSVWLTVGTGINTYAVDSVTGIITFNVLNASDSVRVIYRYLASNVGYVVMPDTVSLAVRNFPAIPLAAPITAERYTTGDIFTFSAVNQNLLDWNLQRRSSETIVNTEIFQDVLGRVTGIPLAYYVILSDTPDTITRVQDATTDALLSYIQVMTSTSETTPYVAFTTKPVNDVIVSYTHNGAEPAPGQFYYITANRLRLNSEYEIPVLYLTRDDMEAGLAPKTTDNALWLAGDIAFDTAFFGAYFCQVQDLSGNGIFSTADFRRAIDATEGIAAITDLVVLSFFPAIPYAKLSIEKMADPFRRAERMLWVGAMTGTPVGDVDTANSLVYLAKKTLQFQGDNPGRGHVVLLGNQWVTRTVVLDDGSTAVLDIDGSYLAAYAAARNAEFSDPADTLLRKETASFDAMAVFTEAEQDILGAASITWLTSQGSGAYRFEESITVDTSAPDLQEISAMNQKFYVTRKVTRDMDSALISIVPPSPAAGVALIQAYLTDELGTIASSGIIAPYGSETDPPTIRTVGPGDMYVYVDELDRRVYHLGYFFNIRYPIKRIMGLYSVDSRFWDSR